MDKAIRSSDTPYMMNVEAGNNYFWCACGKSNKQPLCDGSHSGTGFSPVMYSATESKQVFFCGCKATSKQPLCDGSHSKT
jgi:CDGSH-type Zn-finger protein